MSLCSYEIDNHRVYIKRSKIQLVIRVDKNNKIVFSNKAFGQNPKKHRK